MKIAYTKNERENDVEIFLNQNAPVVVSPGAEEPLGSMEVPLTNNATEFYQGTEDDPSFACLRSPTLIHTHAIRFWRDSEGTLWHLTAPDLDAYDKKKVMTMKDPVGDNPIHLKVYAGDAESIVSEKAIGIVGEMVTDIIYGG